MMNNKTQPFTTAMTQKIGADRQIAIHTQVIKRPVDVFLTIGVFFDGTANNAINTSIRQEYQQALARGEEPDLDFPLFNSSYNNEHTNVYKLYQMYHSDDDKTVDSLPKDKNKIVHYQLKVYIEGVGTEIAKSDNNLGLATGLGSTGIKGKINRAIIKIESELNRFLDKNSKICIQQIRYDVFGFSRGAATARYFANIVADKVRDNSKQGINNPLTKMLTIALKNKISPTWQGPVNGQVHFLGIFDTVAGICRLANFFDAGDANTFDIDIKIRRESAKCGLHIVAANEYRHNFALNDVPDFFNKVSLPGAHSDIGGGYLNNDVDENIYITKIYQETDIYLGKKSNIQKKLQQALTRFRCHPDLQYLFYGLSEDNFYQWQTRVRYDNSNYTNTYGVIRNKRVVKFGLDRIALRVMYNEAIKQGCVFDTFDNDFDVPNEIQIVANKIIMAAKNYQDYLLNDSEKRLILNQYTNSSVEYVRYFMTKETEIDIMEKSTGQLAKVKWHKLVEKPEALTSLLQVHLPHFNQEGNWQRVIHPNQ